MANPQPGNLRHYIPLQTQSTPMTMGNRGEPFWATSYSVWAAIVTLTGRELEQARQTVANATHMVTAYFDSEIQVTRRFLHEGRGLNIEHINDLDEGHVWMQCICVEKK